MKIFCLIEEKKTRHFFSAHFFGNFVVKSLTRTQPWRCLPPIILASPNPPLWFCMHSCLSLLLVSKFRCIQIFSFNFWQTPVLVSSKAFSAFLNKHCPVVAECFSPTPWCWGGRLQTVVFAFIKSRPQVTYRK